VTDLDAIARRWPGWKLSSQGGRIIAEKGGWTVRGTPTNIEGQLYAARWDMAVAPFRTARYFGRPPGKRFT
jgi:hypothetical protein